MSIRNQNKTDISIGILIIVIITIINSSGCKKDSSILTEPNQIEVTKTGCKTRILESDSSNQDCIEYNLINNTLHIKHINAAFNCCPTKVYVLASISHDTILITEKEMLIQPCKCNCLYDIEYDVTNVNGSSFVIKIIEPYITDETDRIIINMNTVLTSSGTFCLSRDKYPWN